MKIEAGYLETYEDTCHFLEKHPATLLVLLRIWRLRTSRNEYRYSFGNLIDDVGYDIRRYQHRLSRPAIAVVLLIPGFQALFMYRISHWLNIRTKLRNPLWWPVAVLELLAARLVEIVTGIQIHPGSKIGRGLYIPHFTGIVIGEGVKIGDNCDLYQNTTLGYSGFDEETGGYPVVGDRVLILTGAVITGRISVGQDAVIGANAVVTKSVPDRAVVGGNPASILSSKGSFTTIHYPGMEVDTQRLKSLVQASELNT